MVKPIRHHCGMILGTFDDYGNILINKQPLVIESIVGIFGVVFFCGNCQKRYNFNGIDAVRKQRNKINLHKSKN